MAMFRFHWRVAYDPSTSAPVADGVPVVIYAAVSGGSPLQAYSSVGTPISPTTQGGLTPEFYLEDRTDCFVDAGSDRFYVTADSFPVEARDQALAAAAAVQSFEGRVTALESGGGGGGGPLVDGSVTTPKLADGAVTTPKVSNVSLDATVDSVTRVAMTAPERAKLASLTPQSGGSGSLLTGLYMVRPDSAGAWASPTVTDEARATLTAAGQAVMWVRPTGTVTPTYVQGLRAGDLIFPAEPVAGPTASFTATRVGTTRQYMFNAAGSTAVSPATIVSYGWDFGDGQTGTGVAPSCTYVDDGPKTVVLTVTDSNTVFGTASTVVSPSNVDMLFSDSFTGADNTDATARDADNYAGGTGSIRPSNTGAAGYAKLVGNRLRMTAGPSSAVGGAIRYATAQTYFDFRVTIPTTWAAGIRAKPLDVDANNFAQFVVTTAGVFTPQYKTTAAGYLAATTNLPTVQAGDEARVIWDPTLANAGSSAFGGYRYQLWRAAVKVYEYTTAATHNGTFPVTSANQGPELAATSTYSTASSEVDDVQMIRTSAVSGAVWKSGASGMGVSDGTFGAWRGRALPIAGTWSDVSWAAQAGLWQFDAAAEYDAWAGDIDLCCGAWWDSSWAAAASGTHDAAWATFFTNARAKWMNKARGTMYIRFAHEWNGNWAGEPWFVTSAGQVTDFRAAWHRFRVQQQAHFPESKLVCCTNGDGRTYAAGPIGGVATMLPNAEDYDVYASDIYQGHFTANANVFEQHWDIAQAAGKPFALGEWGLHLAAGGDTSSVAYLNKVNAVGMAGKLLYDCYFNINYSGNDQFSVFPTTSMPTGAARYQSLVWGSS